MKFLHAGAIYAVANVASAAVPFALLPLLTRILSPADYGQIVVFALLITFCMPFAGLSVHSVVGVAWFSKPRDQIAAFNGTALALVTVTTVVLAPAITAVLAGMPSPVADLSPVWGGIAAFAAGANVFLQCRLVLWQSQGQPLRNAILQVASSLLNIGLSLIAVLVLGWGSSGRNGAIAVSAVAMASVALVLFMRSGDAIWSIRRTYLREQIHFGLPLIPHVMAGVILGTSDRWIVSTQLGPEALGVYGAGAQLGMVMAILADAFVKAYNPWLYARLGSGDAEDRLRVVGIVYIALPAFICVAGGVGLALHWTSGIFLGTHYSGAARIIPWFLLGGAFSGVYFCTASIYFFRGRTGLLASATSSVAAVGVGVVWLLVSALGAEGAAIGYAATQGLLALITTAVAFRSFDLPWLEGRRAIAVLVHGVRYSRSLNFRIP
jgi:O-antigen/teichoic acid export membrane protein